METVELTACPDSGWVFGGWNGSLADESNPVTIDLDGNKTVTATFVAGT